MTHPADPKVTFIRLSDLFYYALLAYSLLLVIPSSFQGTLPYLDSSWSYGLNYFLHGRFHFGPDLIFTYGPLGFLSNPQHLGHNIGIAVAVHVVFWIVLALQLIAIWTKGMHIAAVAICLSLVLGHKIYYDYWDYNLLAVSLITFAKLFRSAPSRLEFFLLPILLGVAFLLKITAYITMAMMLITYICHSISKRSLYGSLKVWLVLCCLIGPIAYLIYDPSFNHLTQYLMGSLQIASGFGTAMSADSDPKDLKLAIFLCSLLALNLAGGLWHRRLAIGQVVLTILVTWIVFRHGFVRGDSGHTALFFGFSLLVFATLFSGWTEMDFRKPLRTYSPELLLFVSSCLFSWAALTGLASRYPVFVASNWWPKQSMNDLQLLFHWKSLARKLDHDSDEAFAALPGMAFRDSIQGKRVMVFPNGTPYVAKINFEMVPIYALQDYSAYTAYLDKTGARNLRDASPPVDQVIVEWSAIDGRNPMLDTPAMTMAFLSQFTLESRVAGALLLRHRHLALPIQLNLIDHQLFTAGEWVAVPASDQLVAMSIKLKPTLIGSLMANLFDQAAVYIEIGTQSGRVKHFRIPPQNLSTPGIINYVPESLDDLEKLWKSDPLSDPVRKVRLIGPGLKRHISQGYYFYQVQNAGIRVAK